MPLAAEAPSIAREELAALAMLIAGVIDRMPRNDAEAIAVRIIGSLGQAGYEVRRRPEPIRTIWFES